MIINELVGGGDGDPMADQSARHRVAGRAETDVRQPVDLPADRPSGPFQPQRRQHTEQRLLHSQLPSGTAQISAWVAALTSAHHMAAASLAVR
jgi:hypothetical protein